MASQSGQKLVFSNIKKNDCFDITNSFFNITNLISDITKSYFNIKNHF